MAVAQTLLSAKQISLKAYSTFKATLTRWITGYITCARLWLPRLIMTLLPFAIGLFEDPIRGPALARALIRRTWRDHPVEASVGPIEGADVEDGGADCQQRACMFQSSLLQIHKKMGGSAQDGNLMFPLHYQKYGPLTILDSEMDSLVHSSIVVEAKAEYNDTYEATLGSRKLKVQRGGERKHRGLRTPFWQRLFLHRESCYRQAVFTS